MVGQVLPPEVGLLEGGLEQVDDLVLELGELGLVLLGGVASIIRGLADDTECLTNLLGALLELPEWADYSFLDTGARRLQRLPQGVPGLPEAPEAGRDLVVESLREVLPDALETLTSPDDSLDDVLGDIQVVVPFLNGHDVVPELPGPIRSVTTEAGNESPKTLERSAGDPRHDLAEVRQDHDTYFDDSEERLEVHAEGLDGRLAGNQLGHEVGECLGDTVQTLGGWTAEDLRERLTDALERLPHGVEQGGEPLEDLLPAAEVRPSLEESIPGVTHLGDDTARACEECPHLSPQGLGLLEVAEDDSERLTPGRTKLLADDAHQLGERLDVLSSGHTRLGQFLDLSDLLLGVTHGCELLVGVLPSHLLEGLHHDLLGQPSLLEGEPERPVLGDHLVDALAVDLGGLDKLVLELLGGNSGVLQGHPVLKLDRTSGHGLRKLIHGPRGGLGVGSSHGSPVRQTLNRCDRVVQTNTGSGEFTDVGRHLTEVVDGLVRICVQLIQSRVNSLNRLALLGGVGENCLNGVELELVLLHTVDKRLNGEAR